MAPPKHPRENTKVIIPDGVIAACALATGLRGNDAVIMVAVALGESGGDTTAVGRAVPSIPDYGLWQINFQHASIAPANFFPPGSGWLSPVSNAAMMKKIYDMQGKNAWVIYKNGQYLRFMARAQAAVNAPTGLDNSKMDPSNPDNFDIEVGGDLVDGGFFKVDAGGIFAAGVDDKTWMQNVFAALGKYLWIGGGAILVILGVILYFKGQISPSKIVKGLTK